MSTAPSTSGKTRTSTAASEAADARQAAPASVEDEEAKVMTHPMHAEDVNAGCNHTQQRGQRHQQDDRPQVDAQQISGGTLPCPGVKHEEDAMEDADKDGNRGTYDADDVASEGSEDDLVEVEYVMNPAFPSLPSSVPLTYTLAMHACLSAVPAERPTFAQVGSNTL